jgi:glycosyltransferase involved in cell wall biosynthesis
MPHPKICIVHDWLVTFGGAERVLAQMLKVYPSADIFSVVDFLGSRDRQLILDKEATTTFIQQLPMVKSKYRLYLPLMPIAVEQLDLSSYDIVISSSHAVAKGVLTGPNQLHVCMCYSPIRYAWDLQHQYLRESNLTRGLKSALARWILHKIRVWDSRTSHGVDHFIAISNFISRRIEKTYGRSSHLIYPPVDTEKFQCTSGVKEEFYVTCSRMVPYKKIDLIVETFTVKFPEKVLVVLGDGPEYKRIKNIAGKNVKLLGAVSFDVLHAYLSNAKAFLFAAEEDFGIAPLEAQSCGTPVLAFGKGGALETVRGLDEPSPTGVFYDEQTIESMAGAIKTFEARGDAISPINCRNNALRFSEERFREEFKTFIEEKFTIFESSL